MVGRCLKTDSDGADVMLAHSSFYRLTDTKTGNARLPTSALSATLFGNNGTVTWLEEASVD